MSQRLTPSKDEKWQQDREVMHRQMLSSVSHDLKTPLASMIGTLEIFQRMKQSLSEEKKDMLIATALSEARRLDNFINNILDMAKLEQGSIRPSIDDVDIRYILRQSLKRFEDRMQHVSVRITEPATQHTVAADPALLARIIGLILDNAIKYGPMQGAQIDISYDFLDEHFTLTLHDNGPGIPAGQEEAIFSKYARIAKQDRQGAGTGLGLAICRMIASLHSGTVTAANHPRGGAIFTLRLPIIQPNSSAL